MRSSPIRPLIRSAGAAAFVAAAAACSPAEDAPSEAYNGAMTVEALTEADLSGQTLDGELGCSFTVDEVGAVFIAMGYVADDGPAMGLVRAGGTVHRVSTRSGGYDDMIDGAEFEGPDSGSDVGVEIDRTSDEPLFGGESPAYPGRIILEWRDEEVTAAGRWTCGP